MKRTMIVCELPPIENPRQSVKAIVSIKEPGIARHTSVMAKPVSVNVITSATGREPQVELIPVVIFEVDPDRESRDRKLMIIPMGTTIEVTSPRRIKYLGTLTYPQGIPFYVFEELDTDQVFEEFEADDGGQG